MIKKINIQLKNKINYYVKVKQKNYKIWVENYIRIFYHLHLIVIKCYNTVKQLKIHQLYNLLIINKMKNLKLWKDLKVNLLVRVHYKISK